MDEVLTWAFTVINQDHPEAGFEIRRYIAGLRAENKNLIAQRDAARKAASEKPDDQVSKLVAITDEHTDDIDDLRKEIIQMREEMRDISMRVTRDRDDIERLKTESIVEQVYKLARGKK